MKHRDDDIITEIFRTEQNNLYRLACYKIGDPNHAADVVQDIFIKVLDNHASLKFNFSTKRRAAQKHQNRSNQDEINRL